MKIGNAVFDYSKAARHLSDAGDILRATFSGKVGEGVSQTNPKPAKSAAERGADKLAGGLLGAAGAAVELGQAAGAFASASVEGVRALIKG